MDSTQRERLRVAPTPGGNAGSSNTAGPDARHSPGPRWRPLGVLGLAAILSLVCAHASASDWKKSLDQNRYLDGRVTPTTWTSSRPPATEWDRIRLHRYRGGQPPKAALLYLPGTNMNGQVAVDEEDHNLWLFLAARGVDVYALDYRTHSVPPDHDGDTAFMRTWTQEAFVEDARSALELIETESRSPAETLPLFLSGFSRGVWLSYGLANLEPKRFAGLIALDGSFKSPKSSNFKAPAFDLDQAVAALEKSGTWASDVAAGIGWEARDQLMRLAAEDPNGPATDDRFTSIGAQLSEILFRAWRPGGLANAKEGVSDPQVLAALLRDYDRFYPRLQDLEGRQIAAPGNVAGTPLDDHWGELQLPVLYFGATGMGSDWLLNGIYSAQECCQGEPEIHVLENYGHLDVLVGERAREEVFEVVLEFLEAHSG